VGSVNGFDITWNAERTPTELRELRQLREKNRKLIELVSHSLRLVAALSDSIYRLDKVHLDDEAGRFRRLRAPDLNQRPMTT
jgi:hypothetical protein